MISLLPHPLPLSRQQARLHGDTQEKRDKQLADGRGRRCRVANTTARKTSINQSILSVIYPDITITDRSVFISLINIEMELIL
jgi:hypothetical protein